MTPQSRRPSISELAAAQVDVDDVRILDRVAAMYETLDPVPTSLIERIQFGITLDALHAEIAQLQRSNDLEGVRSEEPTQAQTSRSRAPASPRWSPSRNPRRSSPHRRMGCPGQRRGGRTAARRRVQHVVADEDGRFVFDDVLVTWQFVLRRPDATEQRPVITPRLSVIAPADTL